MLADPNFDLGMFIEAYLSTTDVKWAVDEGKSLEP